MGFYRFVGGPHDGFWDERPEPVREVVGYVDGVDGSRVVLCYRVAGRDLSFQGKQEGRWG